jgi:hypothetical protein
VGFVAGNASEGRLQSRKLRIAEVGLNVLSVCAIILDIIVLNIAGNCSADVILSDQRERRISTRSDALKAKQSYPGWRFFSLRLQNDITAK